MSKTKKHIQRKIKNQKRTQKQSGKGKDVKRWSSANKEIRCPHCLQNLFYMKRALLNTRGFAILDLDAFNKNAYVLKCQSCSMILWFNKEPSALQ
jgi:hypothetical protein